MSAPQRAFLKWAGGKFSSIQKIVANLPKGSRLIEPFVGSGVVFLNTDYQKYSLNDINLDLIETFRQLQKKRETFIKDAKKLFTGRANVSGVYYYRRSLFNKSADPYKRSLLFLYLNRHCYNGLCRFNSAGHFNVPFGRYKRPYFPERELLLFLGREHHANFTCGDFRSALQVAAKGDVVYCDPPYVPLSKTASFTGYASQDFTLNDQAELAESAKRAASRGAIVLISNHDTPFTRDIYKDAEILAFDVRRIISRNAKARVPVGEVLVRYDRKTMRKRGYNIRATTSEESQMSASDARVWLRENGYSKTAKMIDEIIDEWANGGKKTRRNWWDVLSGGKDGRPRIIAGREFPVLKAAQRRQGKPITKNAVARKPREKAPKKEAQGRWGG